MISRRSLFALFGGAAVAPVIKALPVQAHPLPIGGGSCGISTSKSVTIEVGNTVYVWGGGGSGGKMLITEFY